MNCIILLFLSCIEKVMKPKKLELDLGKLNKYLKTKSQNL